MWISLLSFLSFLTSEIFFTLLDILLIRPTKLAGRKEVRNKKNWISYLMPFISYSIANKIKNVRTLRDPSLIPSTFAYLKSRLRPTRKEARNKVGVKTFFIDIIFMILIWSLFGRKEKGRKPTSWCGSIIFFCVVIVPFWSLHQCFPQLPSHIAKERDPPFNNEVERTRGGEAYADKT